MFCLCLAFKEIVMGKKRIKELKQEIKEAKKVLASLEKKKVRVPRQCFSAEG